MFNCNLTRVYFAIQPVCRLLSQSSRVALMEEIPRGSAREKIEGLVEMCPRLFSEMEHLSTLKSCFFYFSTERLDILRLVSYFLALTINCIILLSYSLTFDTFMIGKNHVDDKYVYITSVLGCV